MIDGCLTQDEGTFYVTGKLSENIETTPEGYLLCKNVAVARTGSLIYGQGEVPVTANSNGMIEITRTEEDLFNSNTLASLAGKAVTIGHPVEFLNPKNWKEYAKGTAHNPRRGEGGDSDLLLVDLLITDAEAIDLILVKKLRQISGGYTAEYKTENAGHGKQREIIFNHVALAKNGRCGSRCAVQDENTEGVTMDDSKLLEAEKRGMETGFFAAAKAFLSGKPTRDEESEKGKEKESKDSDEVEALKNEIVELKAALAKKKVDTDDNDDDENTDKKKGETGDAVTLDAATVSDLVSSASLINPGYKPTVDALASRLTLKRDILAKAYTMDAQKTGVAQIIENFVGTSPNFVTMDEATVSATLFGTCGLMKSMNTTSLAKGLLAPSRTTDSESSDKRFDDAVVKLWG